MIKSFNEYNQLNEAADFTDDQFEAVKNHFGELETMISNELKIKVKLNIEKQRDRIYISSDNLIDKFKEPLIKKVWDEMSIDFWGGTYNEKDNTFWFNPKITWHYRDGGSNGTQFIWYRLWFVLDTNTWKENKI